MKPSNASLPKGPEFCTSVFPGEPGYDFSRYFLEEITSANAHFRKGKHSVPPPFWLFDAGKVWGLFQSYIELTERVKALEAELEILRNGTEGSVG